MNQEQKENLVKLKATGYSKLLHFLSKVNKASIKAIPHVKSTLDKSIDKLDQKLTSLSDTLQKKEQVADLKVAEIKVNELKKEEDSKYININDFSKIELKVGKILEAHTIDGADKLYRFLVDVGEKENDVPVYRTILSGIREYFPDKEIFIGKYVCVVANLAPRKMRGFESNGMLLFAGGDTGSLFFVSPLGEPVPGTIIR